MHRKPVPAIRPCALQFKSAHTQDRSHHMLIKLVTVLGVDAFALLEMNSHCQRVYADRLLAQALQIDLHPRTLRIPFSNMLELLEVKMSAQFSVDACQHVLIKPLRHALRIVIGRYEYALTFHQVCSEEQCFSLSQRTSHAVQHRPSPHWFEVADARSQI